MSTPDLLAVLKSAPTPAAERKLVRSLVALHAARMMMLEPQQFEPMTPLETLEHVPYVRPERAAELIRAAKIKPGRRGLWLDERDAFAHQLARFAKESSS